MSTTTLRLEEEPQLLSCQAPLAPETQAQQAPQAAEMQHAPQADNLLLESSKGRLCSLWPNHGHGRRGKVEKTGFLDRRLKRNETVDGLIICRDVVKLTNFFLAFCGMQLRNSCTEDVMVCGDPSVVLVPGYPGDGTAILGLGGG